MVATIGTPIPTPTPIAIFLFFSEIPEDLLLASVEAVIVWNCVIVFVEPITVVEPMTM